MMKKVFSWMLMAALGVGLGMIVASCKDDDKDDNGGSGGGTQTEEQTIVTQKYWDVVGQLVGIGQYTEQYQDKTFEPTIGEPESAGSLTRVVHVNDMKAASHRFANLISATGINENTPSYTYDDPDVGQLTYTRSASAEALATVEVNIKQIPHLKKIVYRADGDENASFKGRAYFRFGDIVKRKVQNWNNEQVDEYWICVRPAFGPEKKEDSHWVSVNVLPKENTWTYTASTNDTYYEPTKLGTDKVNMQNFAEMLFAIFHPATWRNNAEANHTDGKVYGFDGVPIFEDFKAANLKYHNEYFWQNVQDAWRQKEEREGMIRAAFGDLNYSQLQTMMTTGHNNSGAYLHLLYKGYSWWTWKNWDLTLYEASYTSGSGDKCNMHNVVYGEPTKNVKDMQIDCHLMPYPLSYYEAFWNKDGQYRFCIRHATGKELNGGNTLNVKSGFDGGTGVTEVYRYYAYYPDEWNYDTGNDYPEITTEKTVFDIEVRTANQKPTPAIQNRLCTIDLYYKWEANANKKDFNFYIYLQNPNSTENTQIGQVQVLNSQTGEKQYTISFTPTMVGVHKLLLTTSNIGAEPYFYTEEIEVKDPASLGPLDAPVVGCLVGKNGKFYATKASAVGNGTEPVAMVVYLSDNKRVERGKDYNGLAIALKDVNKGQKYNFSAEAQEKQLCTDNAPTKDYLSARFTGLAQTEKLTKDGHDHPAANAAWADAPVNGFSRWFLPSIGQWLLACEGMGYGKYVKSDEMLFGKYTYKFEKEDQGKWLFSEAGVPEAELQGSYWTTTQQNNRPALYTIYVWIAAAKSLGTTSPYNEYERNGYPVRQFVAFRYGNGNLTDFDEPWAAVTNPVTKGAIGRDGLFYKSPFDAYAATGYHPAAYILLTGDKGTVKANGADYRGMAIAIENIYDKEKSMKWDETSDYMNSFSSSLSDDTRRAKGFSLWFMPSQKEWQKAIEQAYGASFNDDLTVKESKKGEVQSKIFDDFSYNGMSEARLIQYFWTATEDGQKAYRIDLTPNQQIKFDLADKTAKAYCRPFIAF